MRDNFRQNKYTHLTAIERDKLSFPAKYLLTNHLLKGDILDFGCGYGKDVEVLHSQGFLIEGYDNYYFPKYPQKKYDTIYCFYVLNVLFSESQESVIMAISQLLKPKGKAYFAVRRDLKIEGFRKHYIHKKMTYQCLVKLPFKSIYLDEFCEIYEYQHYNQQKNNVNRCIFCNPYSKLTLLTESSLAYSILDGYPLSKGHSLIIPKTHEENYFNLPFFLQSHCWQMVNEVQKIITEKYHPDGFNIGFNIHQAGGQKVKHTHIHLIPRYQGDNQGKKHGIRCVIPENSYS
ncbi:bifunctional class I SAM-dependent methyltransferase/HIT family protein [Geminocystis sp.]|uniref:HIT family protein n=1 Tax=Geminocystis sp. TaxID=2664100 RepID=UPI0035948B20